MSSERAQRVAQVGVPVPRAAEKMPLWAQACVLHQLALGPPALPFLFLWHPAPSRLLGIPQYPALTLRSHREIYRPMTQNSPEL